MDVEDVVRIDYNAYVNIYRMMELQDYVAHTPRMSLGEFRAYKENNNHSRYVYGDGKGPLIFLHSNGEEVTAVIFRPQDLDTDALSSLVKLKVKTESEMFEDDAITAVHTIAVVDSLANTVRRTLREHGHSRRPRLQRDPGSTGMRVFTIRELQIFVPDHVLMPVIRNILRGEEEQEALRQYMVRDLSNKDMELKDVLPLIRMEDPIVKWYNLQVGDVVYIVRKIGGELPYWRYVSQYVN